MSTSDLHGQFQSLNKGQEFTFNGRVRPLTVVDDRTRSPPERYKEDIEVIIARGNNTTYHVLTWDNASAGPMVYTEHEIEKADGHPHYDYIYPHGGERVESLEVEDDEE